MEFYVDGSVKDTKSGSSSSVKFSYNFSPAGKGKHKIKVKAFNEAGKDSEGEISISVFEAWN